MKMTESKETKESSNKNETNDTTIENSEIDNKILKTNSYLSKNKENNSTSFEVSPIVDGSDSDNEPLIKKFEKEIKNLNKKENIKQHGHLENENEKKGKKKKDDHYLLNSNDNIDKEEDSSDDECLLALVKTEYMKEKCKQNSSVDSSEDSDQPILLKSKNEFLKKVTKKISCNINNTLGNNIQGNLYNVSKPSIGNISVKDKDAVKMNANDNNTYGSSINTNANAAHNTLKKGVNKTVVQKSIKKTTANKVTRKKNNVNNSNNNSKKKNTEASKKNKAKRKRTKRKTKTKSKAKAKAKIDKTIKTKTTQKTDSAKGKRRRTALSKSKDKNYNNIENDSIVIGNFDPHNRSNKEKLVAQLLIRWWYVLPEWPPAGYNYVEELKKRKLKLVPLEYYEDEEDVDGNGFRKVYQISAFPGIFRDALGTAYDLRDKDTCPSFNNLIKKSDHELLELICQAIKNQLKCLKNSVYDESFNEKKLEKELKDAEAKLNKIIKKEKNNDKGSEIKAEQIPV